MSAPKRTPTPWVIRDEDAQLGDGDTDYHVFSVDGAYLMTDTPYYPIAPNRDDAEFIVRAVNSHDDLLAALRMALDNFESAGDEFEDGNNETAWEYIAVAQIAIRAAISKAEGEHQ